MAVAAALSVALPLAVLLAAGPARGDEGRTAPRSPWIGPRGEVRVIVRPEFQPAPALAEGLSHLSIEDLEVALVGPMVAGPDPEAPPQPSRLLLSGPPGAVAAARRALLRIDAPAPAVLVSLLAAEVRRTRQRERGGHTVFDRDSVPGSPNTLLRGIRADFEPDAYLRSSLTGIRPFEGTSIAFANVGESLLDHGAFELVLRMLAHEREAEFLAWPTLLCTQGVPGRIESLTRTQNLRFERAGRSPLVKDHPEQTGVTLEVTARSAGPEGATLDLRLDLAYAEPAAGGDVDAASLRVQQRSVRTQVTVPDLEAVLVGGLFLRREGGADRGLPLLGRAPLVGPVTSSRRRTCVETELVVLVRVRVLVPGTASPREGARGEAGRAGGR